MATKKYNASMATGMLDASPAPTAAQERHPMDIPEGEEEKTNRYVAKGVQLIYSPEASDSILQSISQKPKVDAVANTGIMVMEKLDRAIAESGEPPLSDMARVHAGVAIINELAELGEASGKLKLSDQEKEAAFKKGTELYVAKGIKNRTIDPIALTQAVEQAEPGRMQRELSGIPDGPVEGAAVGAPPPPPGAGGGMPTAPAQQQPAAPQGLLTQPSPLEGLY